MGTDVRTMYDKEYLYAYDLKGRDVTLTIERVTQGKLTGTGGKSSKKPVVYFREGTEKKGLALNITNARTIAGMYGGFEVEKWIGKRITLFPTTTTFGSNTVECIRIRPNIPATARNGKAAAEPEAPPPENDGYDDEAARRAAAPADDEVIR
jgi:hypothetical protein